MTVRIEGLDEVQRYLDELQRGLQPQTFEEWTDRVAQGAKQICNDPECKRIRRLERQEEGTENPRFNFVFEDKEAINCMLRAINELQSSMPESLRQIYEVIKQQLEARRAEVTE